MAKVGRFFADGVHFVQIKRYATFVGNRRQMQHTVRRTAQRHIRGNRVPDRRRRHNIAGTDILFHKLHNLHTRVFCKLDTRGIYRGDRTVAAKPHTEYFGQAVHRVCRIHTRARTAGRTYFFLKFRKLIIVNLARTIRADRFKHTRKRAFFTAHSAREHRSAADEHRRNIEPCRRHQKPGHVLVAVGDHNQPVEAVRHYHRFGGIGDQVTGDERVFHTRMPHCNPVANGDRGEHNRRTARHRHAELYRIANFIQIHMPRHDFVVRANDADERTGLFFVRQAKRVIQRSMRRVMKSVYYGFFNHNYTFNKQ